MTIFEYLPCEVLGEIVNYITRPTDLKSLCLVSKTVSAVSTLRLYHDIVIPNDLDDSRGIHGMVETLSNRMGLRYARRLHVGECSHQTTKAMDKLLAALPDNSIRRFSYLDSLESQFPTASQTNYICCHQRKICNLNFGNFFVTLPKLPDQIQRPFLSPITELSFPLSLSATELNIPSNWPMGMVNSIHLRKLDLSLNLGGSKPRLDPVFSMYPLPNLTHLSFRDCLFENMEVDLATMPKLTHLCLPIASTSHLDL